MYRKFILFCSIFAAPIAYAEEPIAGQKIEPSFGVQQNGVAKIIWEMRDLSLVYYEDCTEGVKLDF